MGGRTIFVTGHSGAREWARAKGKEAQFVSHFDPASVMPGDRVLGTLPVHLAAEVCARGGRYFHLVMNLEEPDRRRDLSAEDMVRLGARLEEFSIIRLEGEF